VRRKRRNRSNTRGRERNCKILKRVSKGGDWQGGPDSLQDDAIVEFGAFKEEKADLPGPARKARLHNRVGKGRKQGRISEVNSIITTFVRH